MRDAPSPMRQHVYLSSNFWNSLWIIQQPICNEIQREEPVLYVERFVSLLTVLRYPGLWPRLFAWLRGARAVGPNLRILAPLPLFHWGHRFPRLFRVEFAVQRWWILCWANRTRRDVRVLWLDNPLYECAISSLQEQVVVYHVADEISAFPTSHPTVSRELERAVLAKADLVFAAAEQLAADKRPWNRRTYTVWNAVDLDVFSAEEPEAALADVDAIPTPRVAFVGVVDEWVDLELLRCVAARLGHVHFLMVGTLKVDARPLWALPNVHFLGRRDRRQIPAILRRCSASLVPFRRSLLTERIVPLKIFEALAAGIFPVCTDFSADLHALARDDLVIVTRSVDEFVAGVERAIACDRAEMRARLSHFGMQQTWKARWARMDQKLRACCADVPSSGPGAVSTT